MTFSKSGIGFYGIAIKRLHGIFVSIIAPWKQGISFDAKQYVGLV